jgi:hypothetical protein
MTDTNNTNQLNNIQIDKILELNKVIYKNIADMKNLIYSMEQIIDENKTFIMNNCNHKWFIDHTIMSERTIYSCAICNSETYNP